MSAKRPSMIIAERAAMRHAAHLALEAMAESIIDAGIKVPASFSDWGATRTECFTLLAQCFQKRLSRLKPNFRLKHPRAEHVCVRVLLEAEALNKIASLPLDICMQIIADDGSLDYLKDWHERQREN